MNAKRRDRGALAPGQLLATRYRVEEMIGRGGMGLVYRVRHDGLHKVFAVKVLRDELVASREALARFHQEAVAAASIGHPAIVNVTDYGFTESGQAFLVMEHLVGHDLADVVAESGALTPKRAAALARKILAPLMAAHAQGIVHRDLKTSNVFVLAGPKDEGEQIKLLDFGISKVLQEERDESGKLTSTGAILGTPRYLAPEQAQGEAVDARSDIYALGIVLYELLTGQVPFSGRSALEVITQHINKVPDPPRQRRPDLPIPAALEAVVLKALAKAPEDRFADAKEMDAALAEAEEAVARMSERAALQRPARGRAGKRQLLGFMVLGLAGIAVWWALQGAGPVAPDNVARPKTTASRPAAPTLRALPIRLDASAEASAVVEAGLRADSAAPQRASGTSRKGGSSQRRGGAKSRVRHEASPGELDPRGNPYKKRRRQP